MTALLDGLSVLLDHWRLVSGILLIILLGQLLVWFALKWIYDGTLSTDEYYSLGMAGWMLPALLASLFWFAASVILGFRSGALVVLILAAIASILAFNQIRKEAARDSTAILLSLTLLVGISIFLRLAFVSKAVIPLYFDSPQHYTYIKDILRNLDSSDPQFGLPTSNYYHLGFHLLTGLAASALRAEITDAMLILGQMIQAVMPVSLFFIVRHETKSNRAGLFAVLLSAIGWYMPAYAVNWGKYPALASLTPIQFVLSVAYLLPGGANISSARKRWSLYAILVAGIVAAGFIHTRSFVIFGIAVLSWLAATWQGKLPRLVQSIFFYLLILGIILAILFIQTQEIFAPLFDPYGRKGILATSIVLILTIFARKSYPRLAFSCIVAILLLLCSIFVPVFEIIPGYANLTLLDRPFVEMILYLPLSLLGGLGVAGLEQTLKDAKVNLGNLNFMWGRHIAILPIGLIVINALAQYNLYPSECCNIVSPDDLTAIDWMDQNLPSNSRILVSATEMMVLPGDSFQGYVGTDAGAWIGPLAGRATILLPFHTDLSQPDALDTLCGMGINYIYVGGIDPTFDDSQIVSRPEWYKTELHMPKVRVYRVVGCSE